MLSVVHKTDGSYHLLDAGSPVPLFHQLRDLLEHWFYEAYTMDDDLPTEKDIAEKFRVSRITVRRTLDTLINEDVVVRPKSRGRLRLCRPAPVQPLNKLRGFFTDNLLAAGIKASTKTISFSRTVNERINSALHLEPRAVCFCVERLHYAEDKPVSHQLSYIPANLLPQLEHYDLNKSLMALFDSALPSPIHRGEQQLLVRGAKLDEATHLGLAAGASIISISRVAYMENGDAAEFFIATMNPKFYQFSMTIYADN